jgi:hypothetical protein
MMRRVSQAVPLLCWFRHAAILLETHQAHDIIVAAAGPYGPGRPPMFSGGVPPVGRENAEHLEMEVYLIFGRPLKIISKPLAEKCQNSRE